MFSMCRKQAIIDLGSNTTRVIVMEVLDNGGYRLAEDAKATVRLAEHMAPDGTIKPPAFQRAVDAMRLFRGIIDYRGVDRITACATAAVRDAANRDEFLDELEEHSGIRFKVLTREEEAYYGYLGVVNSTDVTDGILIDLGGGSMEITGLRDRQIIERVSLPFGSVTLTERFLGRDPPSASQLAALEGYVKLKLNDVSWLEAWQGSEVIGIGGTSRTIARMHQRLVNYPFDELHNYSMSPDEIMSIYNNLKEADIEARREVPGLSKDRADIIVGGVAAVVMLLRMLKASRMRVSSFGLRDGIFYSTFLKPPVVDSVLSFSIDNLQKLYRIESIHASRVAGLAVSLFDSLGDLHRLGPCYRELLWAAAMLHESGYLYDYHNRFNNTFYNIVNDTIFGLTQQDVCKAGLIAALYGAGGIKGRESNVSGLSKEELKALRKMGVLLALADALDRSRNGKVSSLDCDIGKSRVTIVPACTGDGWLECRSAEAVAPYFEKAFDLKLSISTPE